MSDECIYPCAPLISPATGSLRCVTFEVESGDRIEFHITGLQYGKLKEGDTGVLSFQGTRYLSFERHVPQNEDVDFLIEQGNDVDVTVE